MNNTEFILWGAPAYLSFLVFQLAKPVRNRSGWDFVATISVFAVALYSIVKIVNSLFLLILPINCVSWYSFIWYGLFPSPTSGHLALGFLFSAPVGYVFGEIWTKLDPILTRMAFRWTGRFKSYRFSDVFFATCSDLLGKRVLITLDNAKVYVGLLIDATDDPNESSRSIKIVPIMSGYRKDGNGQVTFDTDYIGTVKDPSEVPNRDMLISMSKVVTLARFDEGLHESFVASGRTKIEPVPAHGQ